jgi:hypothetical protein
VVIKNISSQISKCSGSQIEVCIHHSVFLWVFFFTNGLIYQNGVSTFPKVAITAPSEQFHISNGKIIETETKIDATNTHIHDHSLSWLRTGASIKSGGLHYLYGPKLHLLVIDIKLDSFFLFFICLYFFFCFLN